MRRTVLQSGPCRLDPIVVYAFRFQMQDSLDSFEKGMGIVLRNAWSHLEALQTTDVPLLVEYITGVRGRERER